MKRLPPEKRNKLIISVVSTCAAIGMVYFFLISPQNEANQKLAADTNTELARLQQIKKLIKQAEATATTASEITALLNTAEADTVSGDVLAWTYDTMRQFKVNRHVDIGTLGQPVLSDVELIANFPYKQIKFQVIGSGYYHDIGKFISDFENQFPHARIVNLIIDPYAGAEGGTEKLSFNIGIVALVKPNS
jgi:Tfp pilus assembly protein PilO